MGLLVAAVVLAGVVGALILSGDGEPGDPRLATPDSNPAPTSTIDPTIIPALRLQAPEDLSVRVEGGSAIVSWSPVEDAEGYIVEDSRLNVLEETPDTEIAIPLDQEWSAFCPDVSAFNGSRTGPATLAEASDCVVPGGAS